MESFFLQKRFMLSSSKPELLLKEENVDMRHEITRKDELIKKHLQKIGKWKEYLADVTTTGPRPTLPPGAHPPPPVGLSDTPPPMMGVQRIPPQQMMNPNVPGMFMPRPGFSPQGPMGPVMQNMGGGNPLAFLEKTTNNIEMGGPAPR